MRAEKYDRQLHTLTSSDFCAPSFVDSGGVLHTTPANNVPLVTWPDGSWCPAANTFMRELFERSLSRRNRGGSLAVAAAHISHLLRYCWRRPVDLLDLTDDQFREFMDELKCDARLDDQKGRTRDANTVIAIGRTCLALLDCAGRRAGEPNHVSANGRIRAHLRQQRLWRSSRRSSVQSWHHPAFPLPGPKRKRSPIASSRIEELRSAVARISTTSHQRARRHTILKLLEITGARRGEIAEIAVSAINHASELELPMLRIPTLKKGGGHAEDRYLPIGRSDLAFIKQYADVHRRSTLRRKRKDKPDHDLLLVSDVDGEPLCATTITQEVRLLAKAAGITEKACPHMFRHRFLTKLFVSLIEQHRATNADTFRQMLLDHETLRTKVAEWAGHSSLASLDAYIDLAFEEIGGFRRVYRLSDVAIALDSFTGSIAAELDAIRDGESLPNVLERLITYSTRMRDDLTSALEPSSAQLD